MKSTLSFTVFVFLDEKFKVFSTVHDFSLFVVTHFIRLKTIMTVHCCVVLSFFLCFNEKFFHWLIISTKRKERDDSFVRSLVIDEMTLSSISFTQHNRQMHFPCLSSAASLSPTSEEQPMMNDMEWNPRILFRLIFLSFRKNFFLHQ